MADAYGGVDGMVGYEDTYSPGAADRKKEDRRTAGKGAATGAATGAALGASIGSVIPVWGTAAGAALGAVGGAIGGAFKGRRQQKKLREKEKAWEEAKKKLAQERYQARVQAHNLIKLAYGPANEKLKRMYGAGGGLDLNQTPWGYVPDLSPATGDTWSPSQYGPPKGGQSYWGGKPTGGPTTPPGSTPSTAPAGEEEKTFDEKKPETTGKGKRPR